MGIIGDAVSASLFLRNHPVMRQRLLEQKIAFLVEQERQLSFDHFDREMAFDLGCAIRDLCRLRNLSVAIEIRMMRQRIFWSLMPEAFGELKDSVRRKRNTVENFGCSSYLIGQKLELEALSLESRMNFSDRNFSILRGGFPITVHKVGCIGAVAISGASERENHNVTVEAMANMRGVEFSDLALEEE